MKKLLTVLIVAFWLFGVFCVAHAKDITLTWTASPSDGVTGYKVYYQADNNVAPLTGTGALLNSTPEDSPVDVGNALTVALTGLDDDKLYSFAVTAYNNYTESTYSEIVTETVDINDIIVLPPTSVRKPAVLVETERYRIEVGQDGNVTVTEL